MNVLNSGLSFRVAQRRAAAFKKHRAVSKLVLTFYQERSVPGIGDPPHPGAMDSHWGAGMVFALDIWLMPAIAAASSSYLVSLLWERFRSDTAPSGVMAGFLSALSFVMGAISAYYRYSQFSPSLESNVIIMFVAGATTTYIWLLLRRLLPAFRRGRED